jgi:hypothetical protein
VINTESWKSISARHHAAMSASHFSLVFLLKPDIVAQVVVRIAQLF